MWFEIGFNILYLIIIWILVFQMTRRSKSVLPQNQSVANLLRWAFLLLAVGDTGHVGFRVLAYALGGLEAGINLFGATVSWIGLGMFSTSITVTLFYMVFVFIWQKRFNKPLNGFAIFLLIVGVVRLVILFLPGNEWGNPVPPYQMSLVRNFPLVIQGLGLIALMFRDGYRERDGLFISMAWMVVVSYGFYAPVILFAHQFPLIGMLMIPKTCAYLAIAIIAYNKLWPKPERKLATA
jgi:hypothetical protein